MLVYEDPTKVCDSYMAHNRRQLSKFGGGGGGGIIDQGGGAFPLPQGGVLGKRCMLTQWGLGRSRSPSRFNFSVFVASKNLHQCMLIQISADINRESFMERIC